LDCDQSKPRHDLGNNYVPYRLQKIPVLDEDGRVRLYPQVGSYASRLQEKEVVYFSRAVRFFFVFPFPLLKEV
jgi:hypothetical protein